MLLHQMLHGYSHGHNLLAASIILPYEEDMDMVFSQSDWDEYSAPIDEDRSYLTIYPLKKSGYLVVAKSWYADEMDRPGCVWTQSILVKLDEITQDFNFEELLQVFRRPEKDQYGIYRLPIVVKSADFSAPQLSATFNASTVGYLAEMLAKNVGGATFEVVDYSVEYQKLVLRLIQYLPIHMLKRVALCSGTLLQRKFEGRPFTLQFNPQSDKSLPKREKEDDIYDEMRYWGESIKDDSPSIFKLTRLFSEDIGEDYDRLTASIKLIYLLVIAYQEGKKVKMEQILDIILTAFPSKNEGTTVKINFLRQSVTKVFCSESHLIYLLCTILAEDAFDFESMEFDERVEFLHRDFKAEYEELIIRLLQREKLSKKGQEVLRNGIRCLSDDALRNLSHDSWTTYIDIIKNYEGLMTEHPVWIEFDRNRFVEVYQEFSQKERPSFDKKEEIVRKLIEYDIDFARDANLVFYSRQENIISVIWDYYNNSGKSRIAGGVNIITEKRKGDFLNWINGQFSFSNLVNQYVVQSVPSVSYWVKEKGSQIWMGWANALNRSKVITAGVDTDYYSFLFILSFNWQDANAVNYLKISFNKLHFVFSTGYEDKQVWQPIKSFLYGFWWWEYWDKCRMLRVGVVRYLISIGKTLDLLDDFCETEALRKEMREIWKKEEK